MQASTCDQAARVTEAESSASDASGRIQLEGAIPEILSGRFGINTLAKDLSILRDGTLTSLS